MKARYLSLAVLGGLFVLKIALQYLLYNSAYGLHRDEFLYLDQGRHLAWGYVSVPPFTSWQSLVINWLGNGFFWVKFFPAVFGSLTLVVCWALVDELKGGLYAKVLCTLTLCLPTLLRLNMHLMQNTVDVLAWTLIFYFLVRYINSQQTKWLFWLAVALGIGFLNKYNILFLVLGLIPALLLSPYRTLFRKRDFYLAGGVALLIVLPNLIWQLNNGLPVLHHMHLLSTYQLVNNDRVGFLSGQAIFFSAFVLIPAFISLFIYTPFKPYGVILICFVLVEIIFTWLRAKSYYALGLFPVLIVFGSVYWEQILGEGWKRILRYALAIVVITPMFFLATAVFPVLSPAQLLAHPGMAKTLGLLRWEDGKDHPLPQDFADMLGWEELAAKTEACFARIPDAEKASTIILCDNYGQSGAINYYTQGRLPAAFSIGDDYLHWAVIPGHISNIIRVNWHGEHPLQEDEKHLVKSIEFQDSLRNPYSREYGATIYLLRGVDASVPALIKKEIADEKREWDWRK